MKFFSIVLKITSIIGLLSVIFLILLGIFRIGGFLEDFPFLLGFAWFIIAMTDMFILIFLQIGMDRPLKALSGLFWCTFIYCVKSVVTGPVFTTWEPFLFLGAILLIAMYKVRKAFDWRAEEDSYQKMVERCRRIIRGGW